MAYAPATTRPCSRHSARRAIEFLIGAATVEPFAQLAALRVGTDGFREGGGAAALQSFARTHEVGFSTLGVRAEARLGMDTPFVARGLIGWRRAFGDTTPTALLGFPGGPLPFVIAGAPIARDSLVAEAGLDYRIGQHRRARRLLCRRPRPGRTGPHLQGALRDPVLSRRLPAPQLISTCTTPGAARSAPAICGETW